MSDKDYIIVKEETIELLELKVNEHMMYGYVPCGGLVIVESPRIANRIHYAQCMIKKY